MARTSSTDAEREAIRYVATLMAASARTAPKTSGVDTTQTMVVDGDDLELIAKAMDEEAATKAEPLASSFRRDANCVRNSECVVLVGVTGAIKKPDRPFDCGACGFKTCKALTGAREKRGTSTDFDGPVCIFDAIDLGVALGSAVKIAADHNIDNRLMYTLGASITRLQWIKSDIVIGIPLSTTGKNPYFDRG
ncbi:MAG: hypothetical protein JW846_04075 [Dehalococcoidia bacterium]|nr:hypothetical protein [Dehalococcoidia bacterium]